MCYLATYLGKKCCHWRVDTRWPINVSMPNLQRPSTEMVLLLLLIKVFFLRLFQIDFYDFHQNEWIGLSCRHKTFWSSLVNSMLLLLELSTTIKIVKDLLLLNCVRTTSKWKVQKLSKPKMLRTHRRWCEVYAS